MIPEHDAQRGKKDAKRLEAGWKMLAVDEVRTSPVRREGEGYACERRVNEKGESRDDRKHRRG